VLPAQRAHTCPIGAGKFCQSRKRTVCRKLDAGRSAIFSRAVPNNLRRRFLAMRFRRAGISQALNFAILPLAPALVPLAAKLEPVLSSASEPTWLFVRTSAKQSLECRTRFRGKFLRGFAGSRFSRAGCGYGALKILLQVAIEALVCLNVSIPKFAH